jgi:hypothetical protein
MTSSDGERGPGMDLIAAPAGATDLVLLAHGGEADSFKGRGTGGLRCCGCGRLRPLLVLLRLMLLLG